MYQPTIYLAFVQNKTHKMKITIFLILCTAHIIFAGTSVLSYPYPPPAEPTTIRSTTAETEKPTVSDKLKPYPPLVESVEPLIAVDVVKTKPYPPPVLVEKRSTEMDASDVPRIDVRELDSKPYPPAVPLEIAKPLISVVPVVTQVSQPYPPAVPVEDVKPVIVEDQSKPYPSPIPVPVVKEYHYSVGVPIVPEIDLQPTYPYPAPDPKPVVPIVTEYHYNVGIPHEPKPYRPAVPVDIVQPVILENGDLHTTPIDTEELKPYPPAVLTPIVTEYHYSVGAEVGKPAITFNVVDTKPYPPAVPAEEKDLNEESNEKPYPPAVPVEEVKPSLISVVPVVTEYEYNVGAPDVSKPYPAALVAKGLAEILTVDDLKPYPPAVPAEVVNPNLVLVVPVVPEFEYNIGAADVSKPYPAVTLVSEESAEILPVRDFKPYPAAVPIEVVKPNLVPVVSEYEYNIGALEVSKPYPAATFVSEGSAEILPVTGLKPYPAAVPVEVVEPNLVPVVPVISEYEYNVGALDVSKPYPAAALVGEGPAEILPVGDFKPYPADVPVKVVQPNLVPVVTEYEFNIGVPVVSKPYPVATLVGEEPIKTLPYPPIVPIQIVESPALTSHQLLNKPYPPPLY